MRLFWDKTLRSLISSNDVSARPNLFVRFFPLKAWIAGAREKMKINLDKKRCPIGPFSSAEGRARKTNKWKWDSGTCRFLFLPEGQKDEKEETETMDLAGSSKQIVENLSSLICRARIFFSLNWTRSNKREGGGGGAEKGRENKRDQKEKQKAFLLSCFQRLAALNSWKARRRKQKMGMGFTSTKAAQRPIATWCRLLILENLSPNRDTASFFVLSFPPLW